MTFTAWSEAVVAELRRMLPATATRKRGVVTIAHGRASVTLHDEGGYVEVRDGGRVMFTPERNAETARVIARSLAAHFDVERWGQG